MSSWTRSADFANELQGHDTNGTRVKAVELLLLSNSNRANILLETNMAKKDVQQGTLALMVLKTLDVLGTLHGYGIARRIEQISGDLLAVNQGTLYPVLLKLEQEGAISPSGALPRTIGERASIA